VIGDFYMVLRKIIHIDLDAFFCAVEELQDSSLKGKPFAVGGRPDERGVVASCSYAARSFGVRSAMPMAQALRLCPGLRIVSSHHRLYSEVSAKVMEHLHRLTPLVEQISIDEAFLDVSDLSQDPTDIARQLQADINADLKLPCSLGVATNKLVAKIANDVGKAAARGSGPPNAITVAPPGQEGSFLAPLPILTLWGVGPKTADRLSDIGVHTIGDLAQLPEKELLGMFGKVGRELWLHANGIDDRPIITEHEIKSISQETTFARDVSDEKLLQRTMLQLSEAVGYRLRQADVSGSTVKIKIRWPDFTTLTRQVTLEQPTNQDETIATNALQLFYKEWQSGKAVRLIGVGVSGLGLPVRQLSLWDQASQKEDRLQSALDLLRERYGKDVLHRGSKE